MLAIVVLLVLFNIVWFLMNDYNLSMLATRKKPSRLNPRGGFKYLRRHPQSLPRISILLPAYKEGNVIKESVGALYKSNYPKNKFEILILLERDDPETIKVAKQLSKKYKNVRAVIVKSEKYKTKPNALNQGLPPTKGDIVGAIDAEDIVEKNLLLKVAYTIWFKGYDAVQGVLDMVNDADGWKNLMQRAEYSHWFRRMLPGLESTGLPIPFGGSTNFFRKDLLISVGGWKPDNLTEDFELGLRIYNKKQSESLKQGKVEIIHSITLEESPTSWRSWLRQRTRWQQGKLQTAKDYITSPPKSNKAKLYLFMSLMQPHISVINITGILISLYVFIVGLMIPLPLFAFTIFNFIAILVYCLVNGFSYVAVAKSEHKKHYKLKAVLVAITTPAYWVAQWVGDLRALKREYIDKNKSWEKTEHKGRNFSKKKNDRITRLIYHHRLCCIV